MESGRITVKNRSGFIVVFIPTLIFLVCFIGIPVTMGILMENPTGFIIFLGAVGGIVIGLFVSVITYRTVYKISDLIEKELFFQGSMLMQKSGKGVKELVDFSKDHILEIDAGSSPSGLTLVTFEIQQGGKSIRLAGSNYSYERVMQRFPDELFIRNMPIAPYEGMGALEMDANVPEQLAFLDELLMLIWNYRNYNAAYRYHASFPWNEDIMPQFTAVKIIQGEAAYRENLSIIEQIKNSPLYSVEESYNYLFINRDYLMVCPSKKIDMKLKTRIFPLGVFTMIFYREFRSAPKGSDHWEYIKIQGIDENGNQHKEDVAFSIFSMKDYYKAKIMKHYLLKRNLAKEK